MDVPVHHGNIDVPVQNGNMDVPVHHGNMAQRRQFRLLSETLTTSLRLPSQMCAFVVCYTVIFLTSYSGIRSRKM